jgi:RES domain
MSTNAPSPNFPSWRSYWNFARSVSRDYRYIRSREDEAFLATVLETSQSRRVEISKNRLYWRAQVGHGWRPMNSDSEEEIPCAYPPKRMKPLLGRATDGRANPRGIPCLYLATSKEAAISEVRPWIGSYVSVGQFRTNRPLTVVDCARQHNERPFFFDVNDYNHEPSPEKRSQAVWAHIDRAFAEPMTRSDDQADYAPTQILAELFKNEGIEGVVYKSNFGDDGFNIALFNPDAADLMNCGLFEVKTIQLTFTEADQTYFVNEPRES